MNALILTLIGEDRPGLVGAVAEVVTAHDGNWVESSLARLSGRFAGVVRVTVPDANAADLSQALTELADRQRLRVNVEPIDDADEAHAAGMSLPHRLKLEVVGLDRPGIVRDVTAALARHGVNVVSFESKVFNAPMSGERMFRTNAVLGVPEGLDVDSLHATLDTVAEALHVEVHLLEAEET